MACVTTCVKKFQFNSAMHEKYHSLMYFKHFSCIVELLFFLIRSPYLPPSCVQTAISIHQAHCECFGGQSLLPGPGRHIHGQDQDTEAPAGACSCSGFSTVCSSLFWIYLFSLRQRREANNDKGLPLSFNSSQIFLFWTFLLNLTSYCSQIRLLPNLSTCFWFTVIGELFFFSAAKHTRRN